MEFRIVVTSYSGGIEQNGEMNDACEDDVMTIVIKVILASTLQRAEDDIQRGSV